MVKIPDSFPHFPEISKIPSTMTMISVSYNRKLVTRWKHQIQKETTRKFAVGLVGAVQGTGINAQEIGDLCGRTDCTKVPLSITMIAIARTHRRQGWNEEPLQRKIANRKAQHIKTEMKQKAYSQTNDVERLSRTRILLWVVRFELTLALLMSFTRNVSAPPSKEMWSTFWFQVSSR